MTNTGSVAIGFHELDTDWLAEVLGTEITGLKVEPLAITGVTTDMARLRVSSSQGTRTLIGKLRGRDDTRRQIDLLMGIFTREARFYQELAPTLPIRTPTLVAAGDGDRTPLLLEDLGGLRPGDQAQGLSVPDAERCLDALADLHAACWQSETLSAGWLTRPASHEFAGIVAQQMISGIHHLGDFADHVPAGALARIPRDVETWQRFLVELGDGPHALTHNDCRLDNIIFAANGTPVFIDWQTVGDARGSQDVANLLGGSMDSDLLDQHCKTLLQRYHARLLSGGVGNYSFDELLLHYRQSLIWPLGQGLAMLGMYASSDPRGVGRKNVVRALTHAVKLDTFGALGAR